MKDAQSFLDPETDVDLSHEGEAPFHIACREGQVEVVRLLLDRGADIEAMTFAGSTSLYVACGNNMLEVARLLFDRGAGLEVKTKVGSTPLHLASRRAHMEIVRLLLDQGYMPEMVALGECLAVRELGWFAH